MLVQAIMKLSVIVPVLNEKRTIEAILHKVRTVDDGTTKEIIIVDGGSIDGTIEILRREEQKADTRVIYQGAALGRGSALKEGMAAATGDVVIFQDADLELDPAEYPQLLEPLKRGEADVVFGSRFLGGRPKMSPLQWLGNRLVTEAVNVVFGARLTDVETCYQVFRREAVNGLKLESNDFAFTVELTIKLVRAGHRIVEIPISYVPRGRNEGKKVRWRDGVAALWTIVKYRFRA